MPKRPGDWHLLNRKEDPINGDIDAIKRRIAYYKDIAEMMELEGQRLQKIADKQSLAGKYADAMRGSAGEVARDLHQVVGRYHAVVDAVTAYVPTLEDSLHESAAALVDAVQAHEAQTVANAMPTHTASHGQSLLLEQETANQDKDKAQHSASDALSAAKARLAHTMGELTAAGQRAAAQIRGSFNDGLKDSKGQRIAARFMKFLKIFVKVLTYIGIALAIISFVIPGVGAAAFAASTVLTSVTLAAESALAATGNGSWAEVGITAAGLAFGGGLLARGAIAGARSASGEASAAANAARSAGLPARGEGAAPRTPSSQGSGSMDLELSPPPSPRSPGVGPREGETQPSAISSLPRAPGSPASVGQVTREDAEWINYYTTNEGYGTMNPFLRNTIPGRFSTQEVTTIQAQADRTSQALARLRPEPGLTYRGVDFPPEILLKYKPGQVVTERAFTSTSRDPNIAKGDFEGNTIMLITGRNGKDVAPFSKYGHEAEILFDKGTNFVVTGNRWDVDLKKFVITMEEK